MYTDGTHLRGVLTIYRHAALPGASIYLGRGSNVNLTGFQNLIDTIYHENLHLSRFKSHTKNPRSWAIRTRRDIGKWILDQ